MKICVCVKQIRQTYARTGMDADQLFIGENDRIVRINPYDEAGVMLAIKIASTRKDVEVVLITLGPLIAEKGLRRCLAMGADVLWQVQVAESEKGDLCFDSWGKARLLARAVRHIGGDLIVCGKESFDSGNGQVGAFMAHELGIPFVSGIADAGLKGSAPSLRMERYMGKGRRETIECALPALLSVDLSASPPFLPTHENQKKAEQAKIHHMVLDASLTAPRVISVKKYPPCPRTKDVPVPDCDLSAFDRIKQLMAGSAVEKKGQLIKGSPSSQADAVFTFLEDNDFL